MAAVDRVINNSSLPPIHNVRKEKRSEVTIDIRLHVVFEQMEKQEVASARAVPHYSQKPPGTPVDDAARPAHPFQRNNQPLDVMVSLLLPENVVVRKWHTYMVPGMTPSLHMVHEGPGRPETPEGMIRLPKLKKSTIAARRNGLVSDGKVDVAARAPLPALVLRKAPA